MKPVTKIDGYSEPARYAAQLAETIGSLHRHLAAEQPDWWQQVVSQLHSRLIADGMTGVTAHCEARVNALLLENQALQARIETVSERLAIWEQWAAKQEKRIDDALDYVAERTGALESKTPC